MAQQRHLTRAPIAEAVIDFGVNPRENLTAESVQEAAATMDPGYYVKGPIAEGHFEFTLKPDGREPTASGQTSQIGMRLHSRDEKYVALCRTTGFALSRLPPYETWETFLSEARRMWSLYNARLSPVRVTRLATRYINSLRLPLEEGASFQTYLNKLVDLPDGVPQVVASFSQRFQVFDVQTRSNVRLHLSLGTAKATEPAPVILDVDAFVGVNLETGDQNLWSVLEQLHRLKNRVFFACITEDAAELFT